MTDQELKDLIAGNSIAIAELRESQKETDRQLKETDHQLRESQTETDRQLQEVGRKLKETTRQLDDLGNKFGSFAEGMALPSMSKLFLDDLGMASFAPRQKRKVNGQSLELDGFAYGDREQPVAYVIEVKSHLKQEDIGQVLKTIEAFPKFFPDHAHRIVYGVIVAVDVADNARNLALKEGLYLARLSEDAFSLQVPRNFKPRGFGPFDNGSANEDRANGKRGKGRRKVKNRNNS